MEHLAALELEPQRGLDVVHHRLGLAHGEDDALAHHEGLEPIERGRLRQLQLPRAAQHRERLVLKHHLVARPGVRRRRRAAQPERPDRVVARGLDGGGVLLEGRELRLEQLGLGGRGLRRGSGLGLRRRRGGAAHRSRARTGRITERANLCHRPRRLCDGVQRMPFAPFRERLEEVLRKLAATPGIDVKVKKLGRPANADAVRKAEKALGARLPPRCAPSTRASTASRCSGRATVSTARLGLLPLDKMVAKGSEKAFEDRLWNDLYEDQGGKHLERVKRYRLLGSPRPPGVRRGAVREEPAQLFFGETNDLQKVALTPEKYFDVLLATGGLLFERCFSGPADARANAKAELAGAMRDALPGWKVPSWLGKAPKPGAAVMKARPPAKAGGALEKLEPGHVQPHVLGGDDQRHAVTLWFSRDGETLVSHGQNVLEVFSVATEQRLWAAKVGVGVAAASADGALLALREGRSKTDEGALNVVVREARTGKEVQKLRAGSNPGLITAMAFSADGARLAASTTFNGAIWLWTLADPSSPGGLATPGEYLKAMWFSPGGETLYGLGSDGNLRVLPVAGGEPVQLEQVEGAVGSPDGRWLVAARASGTFDVMGARTLVVQRSIAPELKGTPARAMAISPDGRQLALAESVTDGARGSLIRVFDTTGWSETRRLEPGRDRFGGDAHQVRGLTFSPDSRALFAATHSGGIRVWRLKE